MQNLNDDLIKQISNNTFKERELSLKIDEKCLDSVTGLVEALKNNNTVERITLECNLNSIPDSKEGDDFSQFAPDIRDDLWRKFYDILRVNRIISMLCFRYTRGSHWLEEKYGRFVPKEKSNNC